jgi:predicted outer membrane repeat protein
MIHGPRDRVVLTSDITLGRREEEEYKNGIEFKGGHLRIYGGGHTIDARGKSSIFNFDGEHVYIENAVIKNGLDAISNKGSLTFVECSFLKNSGAIINDGKLRVENCTFRKNLNGGGAAGAIVHNGDYLQIGMSDFEENCAKDAGAICSSKSGTIFGCNFTKNQADGVGAISAKGDFKVMHSKFENNMAIRDGGAISNRNADLLVSHSTFKRNFASKGSGAISNHGNLSVEYCDFNDNGAGLCGGAIRNVCNLKIFETYFRYNRSCLRGGAISSDGGILEISDSTFSGNRGAIGEEICISKEDVFKLDNCRLDDDKIAYKESYPHCDFSG